MRPQPRDMDFVRALLLRIEAGEDRFPAIGRETAARVNVAEANMPGLSDEEAGKQLYHLLLMEEAGFFGRIDKTLQTVTVTRLSWKAHDFLDAVRDDDIWHKTRQGAFQAGGWSLELLTDLAKGFIRKKIEEKTGISL